MTQEDDGAGSANLILRVAVLSVATDRGVAAAIHRAASDARIETVPAGSGESLNGLVVLMSASSLTDADWMAEALTVRADRLIPVRLGSIDDAAVPEHLREINWIDWDVNNPGRSLGFILAGIFADPDRHRLSSDVADEAAAWDRAGRPDDLLITDVGRARRVKDLLVGMEAEGLAAPSDRTVAFVRASLASASHRRRRRVLWRGGAATAAVLTAAFAIIAVPQIAARARVNRSAIVTTGDNAILEALPEWSAANAAALLLEGTAPQRALGRSTLLQALGKPWRISEIDFVDSVTSMVPYARGRRAAVLALTRRGTGLAVVDTERASVLWTIPLPAGYDDVDVTPDDRHVVVAGPHGVGVVDLVGRTFRALGSAAATQARALSPSTIAVSNGSGDLSTMDLSTGAVERLGRFADVLDVRAQTDGRHAAALVRRRETRYAILELPSGRSRADVVVPGGGTVGALAPDLRRAVLDGADGQLWEVEGRRSQATGIPVPAAFNDIVWAPGDRLVLASSAERGQVVLLSHGESLGHVCWGAPNTTTVRLDPAGDVVSCEGDLRSFWRLPPGPRTARLAIHHTTRDTSGTTAVQSRGPQIRLRFTGVGPATVTPWFRPATTTVTSVLVAEAGRTVVIGSARGEVAVLAASPRATTTVSVWKTPDAAPVTGLGWADGPVAATASGARWDVPWCRGCGADGGLVREARRRLTGCLTGRQLQWISDDVRRRLGVRVCPKLAPVTRD